MRLLILAINWNGYVCAESFSYEQWAVAKAFPGSVLYGPGYRYDTNSVPEILESLGGEHAFDAILCYIHERQLLGEPLRDQLIERYRLPRRLKTFPVGLDRVRLPKVFWIMDFWKANAAEWAQIVFSNKLDYGLFYYAEPFCSPEVIHAYFPLEVRERVPLIPWPYSLNTKIFKDWGEEKKYDVTLLGAMADFYPVRREMAEAFKRSGMNFFYKDHPGYSFQGETALKGVNYARAINSGNIFATCTSIYKLPFMKIYEALACGAALLCDPPCGMELLGLKAHETYIPANGSNCVEMARSYLQEREKLQEMAKKGRDIFLARHTNEIRAQEMREMLPALLNHDRPENWAALSTNLRLVRARNRLAQQARERCET